MSEVQSEKPNDKPRTSWKVRWIIRALLTFAVLILCLPFAIRVWALWDLPQVPHPFDVEELLSAEVSEQENAASIYDHAESLRVPPTVEEERLLGPILDEAEDASRENLVQLQDYLAQNEDSLKVWKKGTSDAFCVPVPLSERHFLSEIDTQQYRWLTRNASLKSLFLDSQGRYEESLEWILAIVRNSRQMGQRGCVIDRLIGSGQFVSASVRLEHWSAQRAVSSELLRKTVGELQELWTRTPLNSTVIKGEYVTGLTTLNAIDNNDGPVTFSELMEQPNGDTWLAQKFCWVIGEPDFSQRLYAFYLNNQLSAVDLPFYKRPRKLGEVGLYDDPAALSFHDISLTYEEFEENYRVPWGIFSQMVMSGISILPEPTDREDIRYKSILIVLAGQAYRRDQGRFPETLNQLVPDYLDAIPIDPYDGQPMKYNPNGEHPVVYSSFLNQIDDGGTDYGRDTKRGRDPLDYGLRMLSERVRPPFDN